MYLIQFRLQFFVLLFTFYTRIKAMRLQAWANAGGGGKSKPSPPPPPPPPSKKSSLAILGAFLLRTFSSYGALFATFLGAFSPCGSLFATSYFMVGAFLGASPPPYENFCGLPWLQGEFESMLPGNFLCDHNLVSSRHVLLRILP